MADKGCRLVFTKVYMQQHIGAGNTISPWQRTMSSVWAYRQNKYTEHVNKGFQGSRKWLSLVQPDLGLLPSRTRWEKRPDIDLGKRGVWIQCETKRQMRICLCSSHRVDVLEKKFHHFILKDFCRFNIFVVSVISFFYCTYLYQYIFLSAVFTLL